MFSLIRLTLEWLLSSFSVSDLLDKVCPETKHQKKFSNVCSPHERWTQGAAPPYKFTSMGLGNKVWNKTASCYPQWARKASLFSPRLRFVFGSPQLIDEHLQISTASFCLSRLYVSPKVWPSLINTYHGGVYPQILLSFLASRWKHTNLSWAYIIWSPWRPQV